MPANHSRFIYEGPFPNRQPGMLPLQKITDTDTGGMIAIYDDNLERGEHTAKLLVAAPEMLAELQRVQALLADWVDHQPVEMCAVAERLENVRATIANAKGNP